MKAVIYTEYGSPDVLRMADVEKPVPGVNDVLVRVRAAAVTTGDVNARGFTFVPPGFGPIPRLMFGLRRPRQPILGADMSGVIEAVGKNVTEFREGDKVFGTTGARFGAYAEYVCMPADGVLAQKPDTISFEEAAGVFFGAHTALFFLRDKGKIQKGQRILINGASGSIGTSAVQLAKHFGAHVIGVCSGGNAELVRTLGAETVIDYTKQDPLDSNTRYDAILDTKGTITFSRAKSGLTENGRLLAAAAGPLAFGQMILSSMSGGKRMVGGVAVERKEDLLFLRDLLVSGELKVVIDKTYPLEQTVDAHRHVDTGHKRGNVVLTLE